jgi:type IV pilus assembly protein PilF
LGVKNNFGRFLCEHGEFEQGMALLSEASSSPLNDKQWMALTNAGRCQLIKGQKQLAENYFKQALQFNNAYAPALSEMQKIAYQNGDFWAAKGFLQRYLGVADHTAETLWFAAQSERALGNKQLANEYKKLLLKKFPLSNEAKKIAEVRDF